jgi:MFS family permease
LAQNFTQLLLARIGVGVGEAGCTPPAHSLISDMVPPEKRSSALAFYSLGIPVGTLLGMIIGGTLADRIGWREAFVIVGLPGVVLALVVWFVLKDPRRADAAAILRSKSQPAALPLRQARWVITTFPQWESNRALLRALKAVHYRGRVVAAVRDAAHGRALAAAGIDQILNPFDDAADHAAARLAQDIREQETTP